MSAVAAAAGGIVVTSRGEEPAPAPVAIDAALQQRAQPVTRNKVRAAVTSKPKPKPTPTPSAKKKATPPRPVKGLNQAQMNNAAVIVEVGRERDLPRRAMLVAVMTGLQESSLRNLANPSVPGSLDRPNEGSGDDFDSLGLFQQRPSQGWGSVAELMNPRYAADVFYDRLLKVPDWESKGLGEAAQTVQRSAVPDAYDQHENRATRILDVLL
ncbi:hypothetical protein M1L60_26875 [Actinoplanes sp. TRM 88003]|uniref:Secreted protein n=2 Tax=Paractinoplanes aksuensis TaxID=2939490 RepID=A0ABT1DTT6_9ACTN|nr:hypothetical protein [Actinoplanes aksuensis]